MDVDIVLGVRHMDDVLAMEGVNGFSETGADLLSAAPLCSDATIRIRGDAQNRLDRKNIQAGVYL